VPNQTCNIAPPLHLRWCFVARSTIKFFQQKKLINLCSLQYLALRAGLTFKSQFAEHQGRPFSLLPSKRKQQTKCCTTARWPTSFPWQLYHAPNINTSNILIFHSWCTTFRNYSLFQFRCTIFYVVSLRIWRDISSSFY
jgi:hypothetical protein